MLRKILLVITIIIVYVLQTTVAPAISMANAVPNLPMVFICSYGLLRGKREGLVAGFLMGLLLDLFYGYNDIVGINALCYMIVGYITGIFNHVFYMEDIKIPMMFVAICDFVYNFIYYIIAFLLRNDLSLIYYIRKVIVPEMIYTVIICLFGYNILKYFNKKLEGFEDRGTKKDDNQGNI